MKFSFNTLVMIMAVVALVAAATWVVPGGEYTRETKNGRTLVVAGSIRAVPHQPQGPGQVMLAPIKASRWTAPWVLPARLPCSLSSLARAGSIPSCRRQA